MFATEITISTSQDADVIYCDSWMSYGIQPEERKERFEALMPFQASTHPIPSHTGVPLP